MWRSILFLFISGAVCLGAGSGSPLGAWGIDIVGRDRGICYLTFSNNFTETGYGISIGALGPFQVAGTWDINEHQQLVGGFTQFIDSGSAGAEFKGKVKNNMLSVHVRTTEGPFTMKGRPADSIADLSGAWNAKVRENGKPFFVTFTSALSSNTPAWFDLSGAGVNNNGSFTIGGAIVITPDNRVAAYTVYDYGTSTETDSFVGHLVRHGKRLALRGKTQNGQAANIRAELAP